MTRRRSTTPARRTIRDQGESDDDETPVERARRVAQERTRAAAQAAAERVRAKGRKPNKKSGGSSSSRRRSTASAKSSSSKSSKRQRRTSSSTRGWVDSDEDEGGTFEEVEMEEEVEQSRTRGGHTRTRKSRKRLAAEARNGSNPRIKAYEQTTLEYGSGDDETEEAAASRRSSSSRRVKGGARRRALRNEPEPADESGSESESDIEDDLNSPHGPQYSSDDEDGDAIGNKSGRRATTPVAPSKDPPALSQRPPRSKRSFKEDGCFCVFLSSFFYVFYIALSIVAVAVTAFAIAMYITNFWVAGAQALQSAWDGAKAGPIGSLLNIPLGLFGLSVQGCSLMTLFMVAGGILGFFMGLHGVQAMRNGH